MRLKHYLGLALAVLAILTGSQSAHANSDLELATFRVSGIGAIQANNGQSLFFEGSWNPYFMINSDSGVRIHLGFAALNQVGVGNFLISSLNAAFAWNFDPSWTLELGPGVQMWFQNTTLTAPSANLNGLYHFKDKFLGIIDGVAAGYSSVFLSTILTHEVKLGLQLSF